MPGKSRSGMEMDVATLMTKVANHPNFFRLCRRGEGSEPRFPGWGTLLGTGVPQRLRQGQIVWEANEPDKSGMLVARRGAGGCEESGRLCRAVGADGSGERNS